MARTVPIQRSLLISILALILLLSGGLLASTFLGAREAVRTLSETIIREAADQIEAELHSFFDPPQQLLRMVRRWGETDLIGLERPDAIRPLLTPLLQELPQISSVLLGDEQGRDFMMLRTGQGWLNRQTRPELWGNRSRLLRWTDLDEAPTETFEELEYDPRRRPWYEGAVARAQGEIHWTAPYTFFTTKDPGITASVRYERDGLVQVAGIDILLNDISEFTTRLARGKSWVFVLTDDDRIVGLPGHARFSRVEARRAALLQAPAGLEIAELTEASRRLGADEQAGNRPFRFVCEGSAWWSAQRPFRLGSDRELRIAVLVPEEELLGGIVANRIWILGVTLVVLLLAVWRVVVMARQYAEPVRALVEESERIRQGDLEHPVPIDTRIRELRTLAQAQDRMRLSLQTLMKMERDLQIARQIQQNTFPKRLPRPKGYRIDAWSQPAEETGGDTYDLVGLRRGRGSETLLLLEERPEQVVLLLADATGHGVGPALSVSQVRAMLRMGVRSGVPLPILLQRMNEQLDQDMAEGRFVTAWLGELDVARNTLLSLSAGQGPILHFRAGPARFETLTPQAPPLGIVGALPLPAEEPLALEPWDLFAVFSDGIYEARSADGEVFGQERVTALLRAHAREEPARILALLREELERFTGGAPPDDDRTAILVQRVG